MRRRTNSNIRYLSEASLIAALYVMLTAISSAFGLGNGPIQLRLSESLCVFAIFTPAALPGVTLGCFISNLLTGCALWDMVFGTLASFIGMIGCRALKKLPYIAPTPYALSNMIAVPLIQAYVYDVSEALPLLFLFIGVGEVLSVYVVGLPIYFILKKNKDLIFIQKNRPH